MRRRLLLLTIVAIAGGLLIPSLAASGSSGDKIHEDIVIEPYTGPDGNGEYALLEDTKSGDKELALRFGPANPNVEGDGVARDSVTPFDRVFNVTYIGERSARVWVSSDVRGLTFYRAKNQENTLENRQHSVTLGPSETMTVGVSINTTERTDFGADQFTIHAEPPDESPSAEIAG